MLEERAQYIEEYGHVRMPIHTDFRGEKFVAVRNAVYHSPNWPTFTDFLLDYLRQVLSKAFGALAGRRNRIAVVWLAASPRYPVR